MKVENTRKVSLDFSYHIEIFCKVKEINLKEACISFDDNPIFVSAKKSNATTTCLVPCAVVNAVWVETGLISISLTQVDKTRELKLIPIIINNDR